MCICVDHCFCNIVHIGHIYKQMGTNRLWPANLTWSNMVSLRRINSKSSRWNMIRPPGPSWSKRECGMKGPANASQYFTGRVDLHGFCSSHVPNRIARNTNQIPSPHARFVINSLRIGLLWHCLHGREPRVKVIFHPGHWLLSVYLLKELVVAWPLSPQSAHLSTRRDPR